MSKSSYEKHVKAGEMAYQRLFDENQNLKRDLQILRDKHQILPVKPNKIAQWMDEHPDDYLSFQTELNEIAKKHNISEEWISDLWYLAITGVRRNTISLGWPIISGGIDEFGRQWKKIELPHECDLSDPDIFDFLRREQKRQAGPIPRPIPIPGHPKGKLDWRPVKEYKLKHPWITHKEIAAELGYSETHVRQKLNET